MPRCKCSPKPRPMPDSPASSVLEQVVALLRRSFVQYLPYARPYYPQGCEGAQQTLVELAIDQEQMAERLTEYLVQEGIVPRVGSFPMEFTSLHDLSIDYLLTRAIEFQQRDLATLEKLSLHLDKAPTTKAMVDQAIGMTYGHLESLAEALDDCQSHASR